MIKKKIADYLTFLISGMSLYYVNIGGAVTVAELISFFILLWLLLYRKNTLISFRINEKNTTLMIFLWIISIVLSDIINETSFTKFFKGIGHPITILITFLVLNILLQSTKDFFKYFLYGSFFANVLSYFTEKSAQEQFRFGLFLVIVSFSFIIIYKLWDYNKKKIVYYLLIFMSLLGFWKGGRSSGVILLFTFIILLYGNKKAEIGISSGRILTIIIGITLSIIFIQETYVYAVKNKMFSGDFQIKYEQQLATGLPLILSGRTEFIGSSQAIIDAPIWGHGSWAANPKYLNLVLNKSGVSDRENFDYNIDTYGQSKIPSHSFIFGEWVEHGIIAAFFMLFFGSRLVSLFVYCLRNIKLSYTPYLVYIFLNYMWNLFFSPLGGDKRLIFSLILAINSFIIYRERNKINYDSESKTQ